MKELCLKYRIVVCPKSEPIRQMVLGTGNQENEPSREGSLPMAPELPVLLPHTQTYSHIWEHPSTKANSSMSLSRNEEKSDQPRSISHSPS